MDLGRTYLDSVRGEFLRQRGLADGALAQLSPAKRLSALDPASNSVAVLMQHIAGNLRSRFTAFLTTDGEKPERDRDSEFVAEATDAPALARAWEEGWNILLATLDALTPDDLTKTVTIRGEALSVVAALERSLAHTSGHVGQIVFMAKHLQGKAWRTLSIPRGQSRAWRPPGAGVDGARPAAGDGRAEVLQ